MTIITRLLSRRRSSSAERSPNSEGRIWILFFDIWQTFKDFSLQKESGSSCSAFWPVNNFSNVLLIMCTGTTCQLNIHVFWIPQPNTWTYYYPDMLKIKWKTTINSLVYKNILESLLKINLPYPSQGIPSLQDFQNSLVVPEASFHPDIKHSILSNHRNFQEGRLTSCHFGRLFSPIHLYSFPVWGSLYCSCFQRNLVTYP